MPNTIEYASIFQKELDRQIVPAATSGWMEANAGQVIYNGGKDIKIPKMSTSGLADYSRENGYVKGALVHEFETRTMTQDRGRKFRIDAMDVNETNFILTAGTVAGEFQRTQVAPEIDAYRYSSIYKVAADNSNTDSYTPAAANVLPTLTEDIMEIQNLSGASEELVIIISIPALNLLNSSKDITRHIDVGNFRQGDVELSVKRLNGIPIIPVSSQLLQSKFVFRDGVTAGQEAGGFAAAAGAVAINWIVLPRKVPIAISKTDNIKIITPQLNQFADAWDIDYRKYHDIWIADNKAKHIRVSYTPAP